MYLFKPFTAYADFNGRARRAEYWQWTLFVLAINFCFSSLINNLPETYSTPVNWLSWVWAAGTLIPGIAVTVRRFHDTNRTGWWTLFLVSVPILFIYCSVLLYFFSAKYVPGKGIRDQPNYIWIAIPAVIGLFAYIPPLLFLMQDGNYQANRFGDDPKERGNTEVVF